MLLRKNLIWMIVFFLLIGSFGSVLAEDPPPLPEHPEELEFVPGMILVKFTPSSAVEDIALAHGAYLIEELALDDIWLLGVEEGQELEIITNLLDHPDVEFAEPNTIYRVPSIPCEIGDCIIPDDPLFGAKWDLHNPGFITDQLGEIVAYTGQQGADIAWLEAYNYLQNSGITYENTVIGIIDTGIRATHQDLAGKVIAGRNYCPSFFCLFGSINPNLWADDNGHGTHVAGIAAARANDTSGVPGVAYMNEVKLLAAKVCGGPLGLCNAAGITNGIIWAVDNGANVLNLSLGGGAPSAAQQNALQYALDNNVLPVCASGNDGTGTVSYPAAFPQCMAVGSTNWSDERASYSNWGPEIEVSAPGGDLSDAQPHSFILSSWHTSNTAHAYAAGTSMAAPQVAGLAGLLHATGITSISEIRALLKNSADDLGPEGFDVYFGHGRVNVYRALTGMDPYIEFLMISRPVVNMRSNGLLQVVLFDQEAETFSLSQINIDSIHLGNTELAHRPNGEPFAVWSDVDGSGLMDLVLHFSVPALRENGDLEPGEIQMTLTGTLDDGRNLRAFMEVRVLGR